MATRTNDQVVDVAAAFRRASRQVNALLQLLEQNGPCPNDVAPVRAALEALPLSSDEFAVAVSRLQNAAKYARTAESGASCYELRLLAASLEGMQERLT